MIKIIIYLYKTASQDLKSKIILLQFLTIIGSVVQMISILSIAPLISILSDHNLEAYSFLKPIINLDYVNSNKRTILINYSFYLLLIFTISNIVSAITYALQNRISMQFDVELTKNVIEKFFYQKQNIGIKKSSHYFKSVVEKEINNVISHVIIPLNDLNSKIAPCLLILIASLVVSFSISLIIFFTLGIGYGLVFLLIKKKLKKHSEVISKYLGKNIILVDDLFKGFREAKIFNFEKFLIDSFDSFKIKITRSIGSNLILQGTPKFFFEIVAIFCVVLIILIFSLNSEFNNSLPVIGVYIVAGYKLMPGLQSILFAASSIRGSRNSLQKLYKVMNNKKFLAEKFILKKINKIKLRKFEFRYQDKIIFKDSNFELNKGTITGLSGESGIGKSTLIDLIIGFKNISRGSIQINNNIVSAKNNKTYMNTSLVSQNTFLLNDTLIKNITFQNSLHKRDYENLLKILKILKLKNCFKDNKIININIKEFGKNLSGGQIQRIGLARALYKNSEILILDEFTSSLDEKTEKLIFQNLNKIFSNKIVFIITHRPNLLKYCDVTYKVFNQKIIKTT